MPRVKAKVPCPVCGNKYSQQGMGSHMRSHATKVESNGVEPDDKAEEDLLENMDKLVTDAMAAIAADRKAIQSKHRRVAKLLQKAIEVLNE